MCTKNLKAYRLWARAEECRYTPQFDLIGGKVPYKNKADKLANDALYRKNNRERCNAVSNECRRKRLDHYHKVHALWKKKNPEAVNRLAVAYRKRHKDILNKKNREYQKKNLSLINVKVQRRRTDKTKAGGAYTSAQWIALCDKYNNRCLCCGKKRKLTADHVVPVSKGGSSNVSNIQPLCGPCNSKKNTKIVDFRKHVRFHEHPLGVDGIAQAVYQYYCVKSTSGLKNAP